MTLDKLIAGISILGLGVFAFLIILKIIMELFPLIMFLLVVMLIVRLGSGPPTPQGNGPVASPEPVQSRGTRHDISKDCGSVREPRHPKDRDLDTDSVLRILSESDDTDRDLEE